MWDWTNNLCKDPLKEIVAGIDAKASVLEKKNGIALKLLFAVYFHSMNLSL